MNWWTFDSYCPTASQTLRSSPPLKKKQMLNGWVGTMFGWAAVKQKGHNIRASDEIFQRNCLGRVATTSSLLAKVPSRQVMWERGDS
jgi:hypothetical protein